MQGIIKETKHTIAIEKRQNIKFQKRILLSFIRAILLYCFIFRNINMAGINSV